MKRPLLLACLAAMVLPLGACADDGYYRPAWGPRPWYGWYDGFYGPIYDGYWGSDGFFWFRLNSGDRTWRRGDHDHFRRDAAQPPGNFHHFEGTMQPPPQNVTPPRFPREPRAAPQGQRQHPPRGDHQRRHEH